MEKPEPINLDNLTQRELLIVVAKNQQRLQSEFDEVRKAQDTMALQVNTLETKSRVWGAVSGFVSGLITAVVAAFATR